MSSLALQLLQRLPLLLSSACPDDSDEMWALRREQLYVGLSWESSEGIQPNCAMLATSLLLGMGKRRG